MAKKHTAKLLLEYLGGKSNINEIMHCMTRLRISLSDDQLVRLSDIKKTEGVLGVNTQKGLIQIIIGTTVSEVYDEMLELMEKETGTKETGMEKADPTGGKKDIFSRLFEILSGIFTPTIPAVAGTALVSALLSLMRTFNLVSTENYTYQIINIIVKSAFYFLPVLLAYSSAKVFKTNITLALVLAGAMLHPNFIAFAGAEETITFLGIPVKVLDYNSSVLPIILSVWIMSYVYRFVNKHMPDVLKVLFVPTTVLLIMVPLQYIALGPIGYYAGVVVSYPILILYETVPALAGFIMGLFRPLTVIVGMHKVFTPIVLQNLANNGFDYMLPSMMMSTMAQAGAVYAMFYKCRKADRPLVLSSSISAVLGITEPALYGVLITRKKAFFSACLAGGIGSAFLALFNFSVKSWASSSIVSLPIYIESGGMILPVAGMAGSAFLGFLFVMLSVKKEEEPDTEKTTQKVSSPVKGAIVPLSQVPDQVFSTGVLGNGFAVKPEDGLITAPCNGTIAMFADTCRAVGILCENGVEILIHIGLDTVKLNGTYFEALAKTGDAVKAGTPLIRFDLKEIEKEYDPITIVVSPNGILEP